MPNETQRVFCISMQRSGTTSVGKFLGDFGYKWAGWPADKKNDWSGAWFDGDYERIFSSIDFRLANAFEDSPWWFPEFYKVLFHRFPTSRFILFTRDPDAWFRSMVNHSGGDVIGRTNIHCKAYRRELEYLDLLTAGKIDEAVENRIESRKTMKLIGFEQHYKDVYQLHNQEAQNFFNRHAPASLFAGRLEDENKWQKLGRFLGVDVPPDYICHENRSNS